MSAPKRLLEDPATAEALRADLQAAANHQVSYDLASGLSHFEANLPNLGAAGSSAGGWSTALVKLGALGVVGGALVAAGLSMNDTSHQEQAEAQLTTALATPDQAKTPESKPTVEPPEAVAVEDLKPVEEATPALREPAAKAPAAPTPKPAPEPSATTTNRDALLQEEVKQLRQIRQQLPQNPAKALALANEGHQRFSKGVLYQEREALALSALHQLGRQQELQTRGDRYLETFPSGSFSSRVRQLLGR